ncbi:saccharopine dehydrogenase NADP-binding domain-containing protein [Glaciecola sp. MH2013]|uniref:saccharopine dehydrogenase family protein n=1 Tax=Glaciecola sp. MH2013 TaxID=2785524 RepID=UPI00189F4C23|nr:saccharopine dehydrogenase NADP-binding domain-containing protein [Glaciecola sp. MH2013]MBF7073883.1 saccharopine dehydrogenase NADP-binding domain-containing protein [Glaciecola sp. MH2013]
MTSTNEHRFDFILYGASSFVGQIMTEYLASYQAESFTWAIAGRSETKLLELKERLNIQSVAHFLADADDEAALSDLCSKAKAIVSTVGPYALYGETLVKLCAQSGTDYCDLTGEPQWIKAMLEKYENDAKASGARIVHCTGFDSIPSDLGVFKLQHLAIERYSRAADSVKMRVRRIKGAASGGTIASMLNVIKEAKDNPALRKVLVNPYVLCPPEHGFTLRQKNHKKAEYDNAMKVWTMPFVMAAINERIVHRSNALQNNLYGENFRYDEAMTAKTGFQAWTFTLGLGAFMVAASISPLRRFLANKVLPKPGEGPSEEEQLSGMFDMRFYANIDGHDLCVKVYGDRDPGYGSTAKMLAQSVLCLSKDIPELKGGFWTPASAMGDKLISRLAQHAGVSIEELETKK